MRRKFKKEGIMICTVYKPALRRKMVRELHNSSENTPNNRYLNKETRKVNMNHRLELTNTV